MAHRDANLVTLGFVVLFVKNQSLKAWFDQTNKVEPVIMAYK